MRLKISALTLFLFASCLIPSLSYATTVTMTLESTDSGIYPYGFQITGSSSLVDLTCINDSREVNIGESWTATVDNVGALVTANTSKGVVNLNAVIDNSNSKQPVTLGDLEMDANLDALYITNPSKPNYTTNNLEVQDAIWSVLQGSLDTNGLNSSEQSVEETMITNAMNTVEAGKEASSFYSQFTFYIPQVYGQSYQDDKSGGIPQQYLGYCPLTPEPSSLILLGTGLAGVAGALRRRISSARAKADA